MYDSREKAARDFESVLIDVREEGLETGRAEGREEGEIKLIRTLQEILGEAMSDEAELKNRSLVQLQAMSAELRARLLDRR